MFIGNSVKDDDLALTAQETVNWYIESQKEGARITPVPTVVHSLVPCAPINALELRAPSFWLSMYQLTVSD